MSKLRKALRWFWNYRVAHITIYGTTTFEHRLFRPPLMRFDKTPTKMRGRSYDGVAFDEAVELTPELQKEIEAYRIDAHPNTTGEENAGK